MRFLPFANQSEMPARYLLADLFVLPSLGNSETWGLAVNEAMHMGVPCLVSDLVGCQQDLVTDGDDRLGLPRRRFRAPARRSSTRRGRCPQAIMPILRPAWRRALLGYTYSQTTDGLLQALNTIHRSGSQSAAQGTRED